MLTREEFIVLTASSTDSQAFGCLESSNIVDHPSANITLSTGYETSASLMVSRLSYFTTRLAFLSLSLTCKAM